MGSSESTPTSEHVEIVDNCIAEHKVLIAIGICLPISYFPEPFFYPT
jgi:hypothetical protein